MYLMGIQQCECAIMPRGFFRVKNNKYLDFGTHKHKYKQNVKKIDCYFLNYNLQCSSLHTKSIRNFI